MVSVCLPSDAVSQHLLSYLGFSYLGRGVSIHSCSRKALPLPLTLDEGYLIRAASPDFEGGVVPLSPPAPTHNSLVVWKLQICVWITSKVKWLIRVWLFVTPWTVAHEAPPSMQFSRPEYWSGLPFPSPEDLPIPGIKPGSHIAGRCFTNWATRESSFHKSRRW